MTGEVALAVLLTIAACLMMKSFAKLMAVDLGYRPERVLTAIIATLEQERYPNFPSKSVPKNQFTFWWVVRYSSNDRASRGERG